MRLLPLAWAGLLATVLAGCSSGPAAVEDPPTRRKAAENPAAVAARQGAVHMEGALASVADAREAALSAMATAKGGTKSALEDVLALIDSAGSSIADFAEPPAESKPDALAKWRAGAAEAGEDALVDLREARGIVESLGDHGQVAAVIEVAEKDVSEAVASVGGKPTQQTPGG